MFTRALQRGAMAPSLHRTTLMKSALRPQFRSLAHQAGSGGGGLGALRLSPAAKGFVGGAALLGLLGVGMLGSRAITDGSTTGFDPSVDTWSVEVQERVNSTFAWLGGGVATTAVAATAMWRSGLIARLASVNPWVLFFGTLAANVGSMIFASSVDKNNKPLKLAAFGLFNTSIAFSIAPLWALGGQIVLRAAMYTGGK